MSSLKVAINYIEPLVIYIKYLHNYLFITLDGKILKRIEHEKLKTTIIRTIQGGVYDLPQSK